MKDQQLLERIALDPKLMVGKPVVKGTRLTIEYVLNFLAHGASVAEILDDCDGLTPEDIRACLRIQRGSGMKRLVHSGPADDLSHRMGERRVEPLPQCSDPLPTV